MQAHLLAEFWCSDVFGLMVTCQYKYVSWHAQRKRWVAQVVKGKKRKAFYGYFNTSHAAADAIKHFLGLTRTTSMNKRYTTYEVQVGFGQEDFVFRWGRGEAQARLPIHDEAGSSGVVEFEREFA